MNSTIVYIFTYNHQVDRTATALSALGYKVAVSPECPWATDDMISIPEAYIKERGTIRGALQYFHETWPDHDVVLAEEYVNAENVLEVIDALKKQENALVLGIRKDITKRHKKFDRVAYAMMRVLFNLVQGRTIHDIHSTLRGIPATYVPAFVDMQGDGREFLLGQLMALRRLGIPLYQQEIIATGPIHTTHTPWDLIKDISRIAFLFVKFVSSSAISAILDYSIYSFMLGLVSNNLLLCSGIARLISSAFNFIVNQMVVFREQQGQSKWRMLLKYYILAGVLFAINTGILYFLTYTCMINPFIAKIFTEALVYAASYFFQRDFVFKSKKSK